MLASLFRPKLRRCWTTRPFVSTKSSRAQFSALVGIHECLVTVHDLTHLQWYLAIPLSTFVLSLISLPIAIKSRKNQLKIVALQPILNAQIASATAHLRRTSTPTSFSSDVTVASRKIRKTLHRKHNVNLLSILALPALKLPLWISFSLTLRSMAGSAIPYFTPLAVEESFRVEGVAWMSDLTVPDTMLLLPVTFGVLSLINVEINASTMRNERGRLRLVVERGMRLFSVLMIPVAAQMPAALCLYWVSSAFATSCQNVWLNRRFPTAAAAPNQDAMSTRERLELPGIDGDMEAKSVRDTGFEKGVKKCQGRRI